LCCVSRDATHRCEQSTVTAFNAVIGLRGY
jgi:hypothetical protein